MNRTAALCLVAAVTLSSCQTPAVQYNGEQHHPSQQVDVYRHQTEIRGLHRVIGEGRLAAVEGMSRQEIRTAFEEEAKRRGAHGVIIQDPADRPYSGVGYGTEDTAAREVTAIFVRYDDNRRPPVTAPPPEYPNPDQPPSNQLPPGYNPYTSPYPATGVPGGPPEPYPGEPYRDPYAPPDEYRP